MKNDNQINKPDLSQELTVFVLTVGHEQDFRECTANLQSQSVDFRLEIVDHVAPLSAALQTMIDTCKTDYFAEVDEDMLLFPGAIERLYGTISTASAETVFVEAGLWDCYMECPIYGIKMYRHKLAKKFPFKNVSGSDWDQHLRMKESGYGAIVFPLDDRSSCVGEHGKHYTPETIFRRWRSLLQKHRRYNNMPGIVPWPRYLLERLASKATPLDLYAFLGAVTGLIGHLPDDMEKDWREECPEFQTFVASLGLLAPQNLGSSVGPVTPFN